MNAGDVIQGRYRLEQGLGTGGMATVWRAYDLRLERPVALKCLIPPLSDDAEFLVRFFSEAQQVARLSHPNVVRVLDFGQGDECPYLVMEYVPGGSVDAMTGAPVDPLKATELIAGAAKGAGAAHTAGIVHRDLKPGNILVADDGTPKLADFGIAVTGAQERLTATGTAIGSPHYVSPEQASGRPIGPPSDVYSLGVVLYELLTGRRPFDRDSITALAIAHVEEEPEPPSTHNPDLSAALDDVVMTCLAKRPEARFATGAEMAAALEHLGAEQQASLAPAPTEAAASEKPRRVGALSLLVALFVGLLVFGVVALRDSGDGKAVADVDEDRSVKPARASSTSPIIGGGGDTPTEDKKEKSLVETPTPTQSADDPEQRDAKKTATASPTKEDAYEEENLEDASPEPTEEPTEEPAPQPTPTSTP